MTMPLILTLFKFVFSKFFSRSTALAVFCHLLKTKNVFTYLSTKQFVVRRCLEAVVGQFFCLVLPGLGVGFKNRCEQAGIGIQ